MVPASWAAPRGGDGNVLPWGAPYGMFLLKQRVQDDPIVGHQRISRHARRKTLLLAQCKLFFTLLLNNFHACNKTARLEL
jgi:hypothetical protein